jgi:hypothetical protein
MNPGQSICAALLAMAGWAPPASGASVNVDFGRTGQGVHSSTGPASDSGTYWNEASHARDLPLGGAPQAVFPNLTASDGTAAAGVSVEITGGFYRTYNGGAGNALEKDWFWVDSGDAGGDTPDTGTVTVKGLDASAAYDIYLLAGSGYDTNFTLGGTTKLASAGAGAGADWEEGKDYVVFAGVSPDANGEISFALAGASGAGYAGAGALAGLQIVGSFSPPASSIVSFSAAEPFVRKPAACTLQWEVSGAVSSLEIVPDVGDVLPLTTGGHGSVRVTPLGAKTYELVLDGDQRRSAQAVRLPGREKLHIYLFIGQSNMEGHGAPRDPVLDAPDGRVLQFGSRDGMENTWVPADHPLVSLAGGGPAATTGMGIEFAKRMLAHSGDPELVVGIVNHALEATAIQWWAPGAAHGSRHLYDEAVQRMRAAVSYGVVKGILWHQGEYNANRRNNPPSEPDLYAGRLATLVDNLRRDLEIPWLPFVCGEFVPPSWVDDAGRTVTYAGLPDRGIVEAALNDLPNHRTNTFCVQNDGLRGRPDQKIHFDSRSQRELGRRYADAIDAMYDDPFRLYLGGFCGPAEMSDPNLTDPHGDNDGDGLANYLEFAMLTDPSAPETAPPVSCGFVEVPGEGEFAGFSFRRRFDAEAPEYTVEVSTDLVDWQSNQAGQPPVIVESAPSTDNGDGSWTTRVRYAVPLGDVGGRLFFRLKVAGP